MAAGSVFFGIDISGCSLISHTRFVKLLGLNNFLDLFSGCFWPPESPDARPPELLESKVPSNSMACCKLFRDLYRILNNGDPDLEMGLGGVSFMGEADFCLNSLLRCECPFLTYSLGKPGGVFCTCSGFLGGGLSLTEVDFLFLFSAWSFLVGMVSIGGGSGFVISGTGCEGVELCDRMEGDGSEKGDLMFLGRGAKPRT